MLPLGVDIYNTLCYLLKSPNHVASLVYLAGSLDGMTLCNPRGYIFGSSVGIVPVVLIGNFYGALLGTFAVSLLYNPFFYGLGLPWYDIFILLYSI